MYLPGSFKRTRKRIFLVLTVRTDGDDAAAAGQNLSILGLCPGMEQNIVGNIFQTRDNLPLFVSFRIATADKHHRNRRARVFR